MNTDPIGDGGDVVVLDPRIVKVVKIVENGNRMAKIEQLLDKVRSDKSSTACD